MTIIIKRQIRKPSIRQLKWRFFFLPKNPVLTTFRISKECFVPSAWCAGASMPLRSKSEPCAINGDSGVAEEDEEENEPVLVPPSRYSAKERVHVYQAVDYLGTRFHVGEHVALHTGEGREWVCVIETLYMCPIRKVPMFRGRWFWAPDDVRDHKASRGDHMRPSKNEAHELICSDNRDSNLVEVITRKCVILSWPNFCKVKRRITRIRGDWKGIYYCDRMYYHKAFRFRDLNSALFPGDAVPRDLLAEVGIVEDDTQPPKDDLDGHPGYRISVSETNTGDVDQCAVQNDAKARSEDVKSRSAPSTTVFI